jgi:hypothetical protein
MPKVTLNKLITGLSGRIGGLVYYQADGQNLVRKITEAKPKRSPKQKANSGRFEDAQKYAARVLTDPLVKAAYKAACRGHQNPRNLAIRDYMLAPVVESIVLDSYTGRPGQIIRVHATDDFRVVEVKVTLRGAEGELIEEGLAELSSDGKEWRYTVQKDVPAGQSVSVLAVARDLPGNTTELQCWQHIPGPAV